MKIALRSVSNGLIASVWDQPALTTSRTAVGVGEQFEVLVEQNGQWLPYEPTPPVPPVPPAGKDQIDFSQAVMTAGSPDVRAWPITTAMASLSLSMTDNMTLDFSQMLGPGAWPFLNGPEGGQIQYTLWVGCQIGGVWYFAGVILCICRGVGDNYVPTGPALKPGQLPNNWYYFAGEPLASYQPAPGEWVTFLVTAGIQRRGDTHIVAERSNVVIVPFQAGTFTW